MEVDAVFQSNSATMQVDMQEEDTSFSNPYDDSMTLSMQVSMEEEDTTFLSTCDENMTLIGPPGKSAYEIAVENGYEGTEREWIEELMSSFDSVMSVNGIEPDRHGNVEVSTESEALSNIEIENLIKNFA